MGNKINGDKPQDEFQKMIHQIHKDHSKKVSINPDKKYLNTMVEQTTSSKLPEKFKEMLLQTLHNKITPQELINTISVINSLKNTDFDSTTFKTLTHVAEKPESRFVFINFLTLANKFIQKKHVAFMREEKEEEEAVGVTREKQSMARERQRSTSTNQILHKSISTKEKDTHHEQSQGKIYDNRKTTNQNLSVSQSQIKKPQTEQSKVQQKLKILAAILKKEINRIHHPFWKLNKIFAEYFINYFQEQLPNDKSQAYEKMITKIVNEWCSYLQMSCLSPYKKWITNYCQISQAKYKKWIHMIVVQQIWSVNNGYLYHMVSMTINSKKIPLKLDIEAIQEKSSQITPSLFQIDLKLQIQGHFFDSIYEMSQIESHYRPQNLMNQLQTVKKRICTDIDNYHRLQKKGERYQIDSDNIIGIVSYILCKISNKIDQIYTHLIFLRIIYGDAVYFSLGVSSYMYSTIFGSLEFLESEDFKIVLKESKLSDPICEKKEQMGKQQTKCTSNKAQTIDNNQFWSEPIGTQQEKRISSMLMLKNNSHQ